MSWNPFRIVLTKIIYVFLLSQDDPFCSLDSKTANYIFEYTFKKFLGKHNKTVIMASNCNKLLPHADQVI